MASYALRYQLFQDIDWQWRWRLRAANGEIVCQSEAYSSLQAARRGIAAVQRIHRDAVFDGAASGGGAVPIEIDDRPKSAEGWR